MCELSSVGFLVRALDQLVVLTASVDAALPVVAEACTVRAELVRSADGGSEAEVDQAIQAAVDLLLDPWKSARVLLALNDDGSVTSELVYFSGDEATSPRTMQQLAVILSNAA